MKTGRTKWAIALTCLLSLSAFTFTSCDNDDDFDGNYTVSGNATGAQVVPAVTTTATGTITGSYNPNTRVLTYTSTWNGMSGAPTTAAFYNADMGANGMIQGSAWTLGGGLTGTGTFSGSMTLTEEQESDLLDGDWYYSYYTTANPAGEIRGQIVATR